MNGPNNPDDLQVAIGDDTVRECWYKYPVKVGETVAPASPSEDGAGACSVISYQKYNVRINIYQSPPYIPVYPSFLWLEISRSRREGDSHQLREDKPDLWRAWRHQAISLTAPH